MAGYTKENNKSDIFATPATSRRLFSLSSHRNQRQRTTSDTDAIRWVFSPIQVQRDVGEFPDNSKQLGSKVIEITLYSQILLLSFCLKIFHEIKGYLKKVDGFKSAVYFPKFY